MSFFQLNQEFNANVLDFLRKGIFFPIFIGLVLKN